MLRIGEMGEKVDLPAQTIRYYERMGLLPKPERASNGYRLYQEPDVRRLRFIRSARALDFSLDDIQEILDLRDHGTAPCRVVMGLMARQIDANDQRIRELTRLRAELTRLHKTGLRMPEDVQMKILIATGRRPNTEGLGLDEAGVELGSRGQILVDAGLRTSNPDAYAAGDVLDRDMFVYVAAHGGMLAVENALTGAGRKYDAGYIPRITFTDPQIASAGVTEAQARQQGHEVEVSTLPMDVVPRALVGRDTRGFIKLVVDGAAVRLLGAHILAPEAGEIIQTAALAIRFGLPVSELRGTMFPYLTNSGGLKLAVVALGKDIAMLSCCAG